MAERGTRCPGPGLQCNLEGFINDCCVQLKRQVLVSTIDLEHVYICVLVHVLPFAAAAAIHGSGKCRGSAGDQWRDEA